MDYFQNYVTNPFSKISWMFQTLLEASGTFFKISRRFTKVVKASDSSKWLLNSGKLYKISKMFTKFR